MNMAFKIGFTAKHTTETAGAAVETTKETKPAPRKSVVRIRFPQRGMELSYYNATALTCTPATASGSTASWRNTPASSQR